MALTPIFLFLCRHHTDGLTNRLARIVDRARRLEETSPDRRRFASPPHEELEALAYRARLINRAITLSTICALLVAMVVATLFLNESCGGSSTTIAMMFVLSMINLIVALLLFLREVYVSIRQLRLVLQLAPQSQHRSAVTQPAIRQSRQSRTEEGRHPDNQSCWIAQATTISAGPCCAPDHRRIGPGMLSGGSTSGKVRRERREPAVPSDRWRRG